MPSERRTRCDDSFCPSLVCSCSVSLPRVAMALAPGRTVSAAPAIRVTSSAATRRAAHSNVWARAALWRASPVPVARTARARPTAMPAASAVAASSGVLRARRATFAAKVATADRAVGETRTARRPAVAKVARRTPSPATPTCPSRRRAPCSIGRPGAPTEGGAAGVVASSGHA